MKIFDILYLTKLCVSFADPETSIKEKFELKIDQLS